MSRPDEIHRSDAARAVVDRYHRRERALSALLVVVVVAVFLAAYVTLPTLYGLAVAALLILVARAPILHSRGTIRLRTDDDPDAVADAFTGPTPPVLAFQWGVADDITRADETTYHVSYLFGLRSVEMTVETTETTTEDGERRVTLDVAANDRPWATYTARIHVEGDATVVDVDYAGERRFGLRRLPQQLLTERYRDDALHAQGYTVLDRDAHFGVGR
ncbi:hypothetical protein [Halocalculus aciditolerans]|uniref:Uncharacterized protein n=1 Tax=Halocalculus aciditolerans TaxID=1383812 RepID=A0A830F6K0_9EURY|nr:hypothetical protein [Halocalculus aciditolerans]GGL68011.1 hypothetical protein GCM10009039_27490 [Halocalculus aciditolerans]